MDVTWHARPLGSAMRAHAAPKQRDVTYALFIYIIRETEREEKNKEERGVPCRSLGFPRARRREEHPRSRDREERDIHKEIDDDDD